MSIELGKDFAYLGYNVFNELNYHYRPNNEMKVTIPTSNNSIGGSSILASTTNSGTPNGALELKTDVSQLVTPVNQNVWNTPFMPKRPHLTREERLDIIDRLKKNECGARIARDYGITKQAVSAIKRRAQLMGYNFDDYNSNYYVSLSNNTYAPLASQVLLQQNTSPNNNIVGDNDTNNIKNTVKMPGKTNKSKAKRQRGVIRVPIMTNLHSIATTPSTVTQPVTVKSMTDNTATMTSTNVQNTGQQQNKTSSPTSPASPNSQRSLARRLANDNSSAARDLKQKILDETLLKQSKLLAQFSPDPKDLVLPVNPVAIIKSKMAKNLKLVNQNGEEVVPTKAQIRLEPKQISRPVVSGVSLVGGTTKPTTVIVTSDSAWRSSTSKILMTATSIAKESSTTTNTTNIAISSEATSMSSTCTTSTTSTTAATTVSRQPVILSNLLKGTGSYVPGMYTASGVNGNNNIKINIRRINLAGTGVSAMSKVGTPVTTAGSGPGGSVLKIVSPSDLAAVCSNSTNGIIKCSNGKTVLSNNAASLLLNNKSVINNSGSKTFQGTCTFNPVTQMITVSKTASNLVLLKKSAVLKPQPTKQVVETTSKAEESTTTSSITTSNEAGKIASIQSEQVTKKDAGKVKCIPQPEANEVTDQLIGDDTFFDQIIGVGEVGEEDEDEEENEDHFEEEVERFNDDMNAEDENNNNQMLNSANLDGDVGAGDHADDEHSTELLDDELMKTYQNGGELVNLHLEEGELDAET